MTLLWGRCCVCREVICASDVKPTICKTHGEQIRRAAEKGQDATLAVFAQWEREYDYNAFEAIREYSERRVRTSSGQGCSR